MTDEELERRLLEQKTLSELAATVMQLRCQNQELTETLEKARKPDTIAGVPYDAAIKILMNYKRKQDPQAQ